MDVEMTKDSNLYLLIFALFIATCTSCVYPSAFADFIFDKHDNTIGDQALYAAVDPDGDGEVEPTVNKIIEGDTVCERLVDGMAEFENYYALTGDTNATRGIEIFHQFFENADCPV
jgi:hypothetical protein